MKNYFFSNLSALNTDLNYAVDAASSLSGYATSSYVDSNIGTVNGRIDNVANDLSTNYATKEELGDYALSSDLSAYATETYVDTKIGYINTILDSVNGQTV